MKRVILVLSILVTLTGCNEIFYDLPPEPVVYPTSNQRVEVEINDGPSRPYQSSRYPGQVVVR